MLNGFEEQTKKLTDKEKIQARIIYRYLSNAFSVGKGITNDKMRKMFKLETGDKISGARVRKMINWMHVNGYLKGLKATSNGYAQAKSLDELISYKESLVGRISAVQERIKAVENDIKMYDQSQRNGDLFNG